jgi:hypothetical protein
LEKNQPRRIIGGVVVDAAGEVVELTWTFVGSVYFGIEFPPMMVARPGPTFLGARFVFLFLFTSPFRQRENR